MSISARAKLGVVLLGFLPLVAGSVVATFVTLRAQATDALVINLAGRQRMLTQQMNKAILGLIWDPNASYETELGQAAHLFDRTLTALSVGGEIPYAGKTVILPPTSDPTIRAQLEAVAQLWDRFRVDIENAQAQEPGSAAAVQAIHDVELLSPILLQEMDRAVQLYESAAEAKLARLRITQALFTFGAVGLLITGYILTQRTISRPLADLQVAARRIACGDLTSPISARSGAGSEIHELAGSLEEMRCELAAAHLEQGRWATELETLVEQRTRQLAALFEVSAEISSRLEIERVLQLIVDKTRCLAGGEVAILCMIDPSDQSLIVAKTSGTTAALVRDPQRDLQLLTPEAVGETVEALIRHEGHLCPLLQPEFRHSHLAVPLCIGDRTLGGLCVGHRQAHRFGEEDARLLTLLAHAGAIALENAHSYKQAEQAAALAERERILAEIHDGLAQTLSFLDLRLDVVQALIQDRELDGVPHHLALMRRTVEQADQEARRLMAHLHASADTPRTLEDLLQQAVERFVEERDMLVEIEMEAVEPVLAPPEISQQVVRVALEALVNVHKHATSNRATLTLARRGDYISMRIEDDGPGFDVHVPPADGHHFGLKVMKARAEHIGGELRVESTPGRGTIVTLSWPWVKG